MMTLLLSNSLKSVFAYLKELKSSCPNIIIDEKTIELHFQSLNDGYGIRLLNALETDNLGVFLFYSKKFNVLMDKDGIAHIRNIDESEAVQILAMFYGFRATATMYPEKSAELNCELNNKIFTLFEK